MVAPRIVETENGLQGNDNAVNYDQMMRKSRDDGHLYTDQIIQSGIVHGTVLEIGTGPGYLGLEWLRKTVDTILKGIDISAEMVAMAEKNAKDYGFSGDRAAFTVGDAHQIPFPGNTFDAVFSNSTLHEWNEPERVLEEIHRVLKPEGRFYISDLRRNMPFFVKNYMKRLIPKDQVPGLMAAIQSAYTVDEAKAIMKKSKFTRFKTSVNPFSLMITGAKSVSD